MNVWYAELKALIESLADQVREDALANFTAFEAQAQTIHEQAQTIHKQAEMIDKQARMIDEQAQAFREQGSRLEVGLRELAGKFAAAADLQAQMAALEQRVKTLEDKSAAA